MLRTDFVWLSIKMGHPSLGTTSGQSDLHSWESELWVVPCKNWSGWRWHPITLPWKHCPSVSLTWLLLYPQGAILSKACCLAFSLILWRIQTSPVEYCPTLFLRLARISSVVCNQNILTSNFANGKMVVASRGQWLVQAHIVRTLGTSVTPCSPGRNDPKSIFTTGEQTHLGQNSPLYRAYERETGREMWIMAGK